MCVIWFSYVSINGDIIMNIYDFDGTIYDGDSSVDFFKFCLRKNKKIYLLFPGILLYFILFLLKIKTKEEFKSKYFSFLKCFEDIDEVVNEFWDKNLYKIKKFYLDKKNNTDIIISASPEFLLKPVSKKLKFKLIATKVDKKNGLFLGKNCYGKEKVKRLNKINIYDCLEFYSDSLSDIYLVKIAKKAFIVKGDEIINFNDYKEPLMHKIKKFIFK